jgi:hypothetical protein
MLCTLYHEIAYWNFLLLQQDASYCQNWTEAGHYCPVNFFARWAPVGIKNCQRVTKAGCCQLFRNAMMENHPALGEWREDLSACVRWWWKTFSFIRNALSDALSDRLTVLRGGEKGSGFFFSCCIGVWLGGLLDSFELGWDVSAKKFEMLCFWITVCFRQFVGSDIIRSFVFIDSSRDSC